MNRDILILSESPFTRWYYDAFGIEVLSRDFNVQVLDCTAWLKPHFWKQYSETHHEFPGYLAIGGWDEFSKSLSALSNPIALYCLSNCPTSQRIHRQLKSLGVPVAIIHSGLLPGLSATTSMLDRVKNAYRQGNLGRAILNRLYRKIYPPLSADIAILSGEDSLKDIRAAVAPHQIWAHSFDYDIYLRLRDKTREQPVPYAIFLDEDMVYHPDWDYIGIRAPATEKGYYGALRNFFEKFERISGLRIVIAAHPRFRHDLRPHLFAGREVVYGRTAELVRDAALVFAHASTSISFAVLWHKPMVFLTTNELDQSHYGPHIKFRSRLFHVPLYNCSLFDQQNIDLEAWLHVNELAYADYKRAYIKREGTSGRPIWEIFSEYVRKNLN